MIFEAHNMNKFKVLESQFKMKSIDAITISFQMYVPDFIKYELKIVEIDKGIKTN